jgi:hypothetical protein
MKTQIEEWQREKRDEEACTDILLAARAAARGERRGGRETLRRRDDRAHRRPAYARWQTTPDGMQIAAGGGYR